MKTVHLIFMLAIITMLGLNSCNKDTCENQLCENGGVCTEGICDCPESYTGPNCRDQATPDRMRITSVIINRFPGLNNKVEWDGTDGPDIFFRLWDGDHRLAQPLILWENADATREYSFFISLIDIRNLTGEHTMQLLDYEGIDIPDDFMGEVKFIPYHSTNGFPETIILDNGGPVAFTLTVDYLYNKDPK